MEGQQRANLFAGIPSSLPEELTNVLVEGSASGTVRIERIVSKGHSTSWYDQNESEWVVVLKGSAELEFAGGEITALAAGDYIFLPPHKKHRVAKTDDKEETVWLAVFF